MISSRLGILKRVGLLILTLALLSAPAQGKSKYSMPYYITVDLTNQIVTIYNTSDDSIAHQMICSTGLDESTPRGTYYLPEPYPGERETWYYFSIYNCFAQYGTRIIDNVLFHSIPSTYKTWKSISQQGLKMLGEPASHGCIRMLWPDAKFIAEQCAPGTRVEIYKSKKVNEDLRQLLKAESYDGSQSYNAYLGLVDNANGQSAVLGLTSTGEAVRDLQYRLRNLGIFAGKITGEYHGDTVNAVRFAQKLMGLDPTGTADEDFRSRIFAEDAPVALNVPLEDGFNGPAVRKLQQFLTDLRVYDGPMDSIYDLEVANALKRFEIAYGYEPNDVAAVEVQKMLAYEVERIHDIFDPLGGYSFDKQEESVSFGWVRAASGVTVRSKAATSGDKLGHVPNKALVVVLEKSGEWSKIQHGNDVGYVKNEYMEYRKGQNNVLTYTSLDGYASYRIGHTQAEYLAGQVSQAERIEQKAPEEDPMVVVNTGREDLMLNLRSAPDASGDVIGMLPNGAQVRLLLDVGEWALADCNGARGYLMKQYTAHGTDGDQQSGAALQAIVKPRYGNQAQIYDADADDAEILGTLNAALYVDVIGAADQGWSHIKYQGHDGYMRDEDLLILSGV